jgi:catechol 2,3-dioxygenase-like lactoylglutathione lyase family enzyme
MTTTAGYQTADQAQLPTPQFAYAKLPASDVNRARAFWREKFGLEPYAENHNHLYYDIGGTNVLVFPSSGSASGTHDQLGLIVPDLEKEVARLRATGVTFEEFPAPPGATVTNGIMDRGNMKAAWFTDTEGNLISIAEFSGGSPFRH